MNPSPAQDISRHVPQLYRVAMRLVADADTANDVVQEACVKALANMADFNAHCSLATWLHRIIVNCALSNGRSEQRRQRAYATAGETVRARQGGEESSPAAIAEASELSALAWELVERLPEDCRSAFVLTHSTDTATTRLRRSKASREGRWRRGSSGPRRFSRNR